METLIIICFGNYILFIERQPYESGYSHSSSVECLLPSFLVSFQFLFPFSLSFGRSIDSLELFLCPTGQRVRP